MQNPSWRGNDRLDSPPHTTEDGHVGKEHDPGRELYSSDGLDSASENAEMQAGVKRIEAVSKAWTKTSLIVSYVT